MLVLAMQINQRAGSVTQCAGRDQCAVDVRPTSALRRHFPPHDQLAAVRRVEDRLDGRSVFSGADDVRRGAPADEEPDRADVRLHGADEPDERSVERLLVALDRA